MKHKTATRLESLSSRLVRRDAIECFADNCKKIWGDWTSLLRKTTLPPHVASSDARVIAAFRAVDDVILEKQSTCVLRWLAYMRLMALFDHLKPVVKSERENGGAHRGRGDRDISAIVDIYENARRRCSNTQASRNAIVENRRTGKCVRTLAGPSPLFLLVYTEAAEPIMYASLHMSLPRSLSTLIIPWQKRQKDRQPNFSANCDQSSAALSFPVRQFLYSSR